MQARIGVEAAQKDLEDIAPPLSAQGEELDEAGEQADPYTVSNEEGRRTTTADEPRFEREADGATRRIDDPEVKR